MSVDEGEWIMAKSAADVGMTTLEVDRGHLHVVRQCVEDGGAVLDGLHDGEALLKVEGFALTSNNITYAVFGDGLRYWDFFPAQADAEHAWGRIPVWGFASVVASKCSGVTVGDRVYGYLPMSSHLVVRPGRVDERGWTDLAPHRSAMAAAYNRYVATGHDPIYRSDREAEQMILWPLFMTSFMIDDHVGASLSSSPGVGDDVTRSVIISSASSKTAIGTAYLASRRPNTRVIGLTSTANADFVRSLGCYDLVFTYDAIDAEMVSAIAAQDGSCAYVDIAGNASVTRQVHRMMGDRLQLSLIVGGTHWDAPSGSQEAPAESAVPLPTPEFFFAPTLIAQRTKEWGRDGFDARVGSAWENWVEWCGSWLIVDRVEGAEATVAAYQDLLAGKVDPRHGLVARI